MKNLFVALFCMFAGACAGTPVEPIEMADDAPVCEAYDEEQGDFVEIASSNETCEQLGVLLAAYADGVHTRNAWDCEYGTGTGHTVRDCKGSLNCGAWLTGTVPICSSIDLPSGGYWGLCLCGYVR